MSASRMSVRVVALVAALLWTQPAQAQQWLELNVGGYSLRDLDTRIDDDVLLENSSLFAFDLCDLCGLNVGGEWQAGLGRYFEVGVGVDYHGGTAPSTYYDYVDDDDSEIQQDFRLRITPVTFTLRVVPFGTRAAFQPYFGGGVGLYNWRYSEVGDFIDFTNFEVFNDRFVATGTDVGAVILGGARFPIGSRMATGVEVRYHQAAGTVGIDQGFLAERIDLGGLSTRFTFRVRF